ncbi:hypothetical protein GCM10010233_36380 [Streptomyces pseudogriseolus]|uniref:Uncharacterized protein n=1 Tax=Streptomyces pseudogriseolus TaxID=36817 RepID=A0ABQ2T2T8_STREZ|nr:hypothetical protein GCM10010233_36380 [Streptomyces gancidicus]GGS50248.1 hypothetical protein GCM10010285_32220 [Streptomyces rubiginosus]
MWVDRARQPTLNVTSGCDPVGASPGAANTRPRAYARVRPHSWAVRARPGAAGAPRRAGDAPGADR